MQVRGIKVGPKQRGGGIPTELRKVGCGGRVRSKIFPREPAEGKQFLCEMRVVTKNLRPSVPCSIPGANVEVCRDAKKSHRSRNLDGIAHPGSRILHAPPLWTK